MLGHLYIANHHLRVTLRANNVHTDLVSFTPDHHHHFERITLNMQNQN